ncbi:ATP/GTP-binding protein [Streptomyces viridiviolaceus]|uniref:ATP/GTP-binding protein n=1 Tax=Streptomyces viridiviolaceus TaxID=68282 RepID=A0ABW2DV57_9ACTN|nr:ATP/GTP-binding protein [Streptomyces viridiviolaceus]
MSFCVGVRVPGKTGDTDSGSSQGEQTSRGKGAAPARDCHVRKMDPQPPPGSQYYRDGETVYERVCVADGQAGLVDVEVVGADPGQNVPAVDPEVVAQQAVDKMTLLGPDIASPRANGKYTVGVPMWMWVNQSATTFGPNTASASAGDITVTATAKVSKIVWQMGDGTSVTCNGPGTPYTGSADMTQSPTCGHLYSTTSASAPGGRYAVTATSTWTIDWQGGGEAGQLTEVRQSDVQVPVGELQVVR